MKAKKRTTAFVGKCPHCSGLITLDRRTMDLIAEAAIDAVTRVELQRNRSDTSTPHGPLMTFHIGPSATNITSG